jgi:hypothetical protein
MYSIRHSQEQNHPANSPEMLAIWGLTQDQVETPTELNAIPTACYVCKPYTANSTAELCSDECREKAKHLTNWDIVSL